MQVFIIWSGERSKAVAETLRAWLPKVIQSLAPWMSEVDIDAGTAWPEELWQQLEKAHFGIVCLTPENPAAPWLNFEAGATAKAVGKSRVCPYLFPVGKKSAVTGPLSRFQANNADREGTWNIVSSLNERLGDKEIPGGKLEPHVLRSVFDKWYSELEDTLRAIPEPTQEVKPDRDQAEILEEVLELARSLSRSASAHTERLNQIEWRLPPPLPPPRLGASRTYLPYVPRDERRSRDVSSSGEGGLDEDLDSCESSVDTDFVEPNS